MSSNAFTKTGNTIAFVANVAAPTAVQCTSTTLGGNQYRIINSSSVTVFLGYGTSSSDASNNAVVVTTTGLSFPLLAGTDEILSFVPNAYFTGITASGTANVYITPGDGL
jgi:gamma-glutamyltranspeptidase